MTWSPQAIRGGGLRAGVTGLERRCADRGGWAGIIEPTPEFGARLSTEFILGMAKVKGPVTILLDVNRIVGADPIRLADAAGP